MPPCALAAHGGAELAERRAFQAEAPACLCEIRCVQLVLRGVPPSTVPATLALTLRAEGARGKRSTLVVDGKALAAGEAATLVLHRQWDNAVTFLASTQVAFRGGRVRFLVTAGSGALVLDGAAGVDGLRLSHADGAAMVAPRAGCAPRQSAEMSLLGSFSARGDVLSLVQRAPVAPGAFRQRRLSFSAMDVIHEERVDSRGGGCDSAGEHEGGGGAIYDSGRGAGAGGGGESDSDDGGGWYSGRSARVYRAPTAPSPPHHEGPTLELSDSDDDNVPVASAGGGADSAAAGRLGGGPGHIGNRRLQYEGGAEHRGRARRLVRGLLSHLTPERWGGTLEANVSSLASAATSASTATAFGTALGIALSTTVFVHGLSMLEKKRLLPRAIFRGLGKHRAGLVSASPPLLTLQPPLMPDDAVTALPPAPPAPLPLSSDEAEGAEVEGADAPASSLHVADTVPWAIAIAHRRLVEVAAMGTAEARAKAAKGRDYVYGVTTGLLLAARNSKTAHLLPSLYNSTSIS